MTLFSFFKRNKQPAFDVIIGSRKCRVAAPTALRYHKLMQLLELPDTDKILKLQSELEAKMQAFAKEQRDDLRAEIVNLDKAIQAELVKHSTQIQTLFKSADYAKLKEIIGTVCEGEVSEEDIKNCFEVQVAVAVDFFLAWRMKISTSITDKYATYARKNLHF